MSQCQCGCNQPIPKSRNRTDRQTPRFIKGHNLRIRTLSDKVCETCGKIYRPRHKNQHFCSQVCFSPTRSQHRRRRVKCVCVVCGKTFETKQYRSSAKYCSRECWSVRNPPETKLCAFCGREFISYDRAALYCSRSCAKRDKVGENATAWKGGRAAHRKRSQFKGELANWRMAVYKRDDYICQHCGSNGDNLHAHHIKPLSEYPDLALDIGNGLTLCIPCHEKEHGRKLSTPSHYPKRCIDCDAQTSGRSYRCRSCSISYAHQVRGRKQTKECPQCHKEFAPNRPNYKYCSPECRKEASYDSETVYCSICGKAILRQRSLIERNKTGTWYCSRQCHRSRPINLISLTCPICGKTFAVKPYRIKEGKVITCSRECAYQQISLTRQAKQVQSP